MALSKACRAAISCCSLRLSADFTVWSCVAYVVAMSSRLAWMAAFTLEVSSATSFLYFWFSLSSSVTFAFTMAIDSFIFGTWSFRSRMFCSRISSGSSAAEIIQPNIERNARFMRCHIAKPPEGRPLKA